MPLIATCADQARKGVCQPSMALSLSTKAAVLTFVGGIEAYHGRQISRWLSPQPVMNDLQLRALASLECGKGAVSVISQLSWVMGGQRSLQGGWSARHVAKPR